MHDWGGDFKNFYEVGQAADEIGEFCRRWGRIGVRQTKEKYGTARVYCSLGWYQLHCITHPGHCYSRYPKWLWKFDINYLSKIIRRIPIIRYHKFIYRLAYKRALRKYPFIRDEIIYGADWSEFLEGL